MPEWLKEWALAELRELSRAKVAAVLILAVGLSVGWLLARGYYTDLYSERIAIMEQRISALSEGLNAPPMNQSAHSGEHTIYRPNWLWLVVGAALVIALFATARASAKRKGDVDRLLGDVESVNGALKDAHDAHGKAVERLQDVAEIKATLANGQLADTQQELERVKTERDRAIAALKDKKLEYAMEVFERYSNARPTEGSPRITVTVRYANYGHDYDLAQQIKGLFEQYIRWPVTLDANNTPALPRAEKFKVVFDVGCTYFTYGELIHAVAESEILGVQIGKKEFVDRRDSHHLIVLVLPSVGSEPIEAEQA
jgi:hypothetical protein